MKKLFIALFMALIMAVTPCTAYAGTVPVNETDTRDNGGDIAAKGAACTLFASGRTVTTVNGSTGITLQGFVFRPSSPNGKTVIICHGLSGYAKQALDIARQLSNAGYAVFAFDFAGGGPDIESGGNMTDMSVLTELSDLEYIFEYVKAQPYVDAESIYLAGHSQGGIVSGLYAAEHPSDVKALMLYAPGFVVTNEWAPASYSEIPSWDVWMWGEMVVGPAYFRDLWTLLEGSRTKIYDLMSGYTGPVMMLHGTGDATTSIDYTRTMRDCYQNAVLIEYEGVDHVFSGEAVHEQFMRDTLSFLENH